MTFLVFALMAGINLCDTRIDCSVERQCTCQVPPQSAEGAYFHWDLHGIARGQRLACSFISFGLPVWLQADATQLPNGVTMDCGNCGSTPKFLRFDTERMDDENDSAVITWYVPPSNESAVTSLVCNVDTSCPTHTDCSTHGECGCTVPARSAAGGHFYWDISGFTRGQTVRCEFLAKPGSLWIRADASQLPNGVTMDCGDCRATPKTLVFDTSQMDDSNGKAVIKWYMPPSDMPTSTSLQCYVGD